MPLSETLPKRIVGVHPLLAILFLGCALRLLWILLIPINPISDAAAYETFATNIAEHGVYGWTPYQPGAYWAVGPAAIYAAGYMVFGTGSTLAVVLPNILSSIVVICGLFDLGRRWFDRRVGVIAALLFAIWPLTIQFTTVLASELHFMALSVMALVTWERSASTLRGALYLVISGIFLAAATYVRPIALLIPAALVIASMVRTFTVPWQDLARAAGATVLIFLLVAPWSARNERVFEEPVFMSTNFWANFWMGNNPDTAGSYMPLPAETNGMSETERSDYLKALALTHLKEAPGAFVERVFWKSFLLHERETIGVAWNEKSLEALVGASGVTLAKLISTGYWYLMLAGAGIGIILLARQTYGWRVFVSPPVWLWLYFTGVHAVIVVGDRYHMPAIPMIAVLAAVGLTRVIPALERGSR